MTNDENSPRRPMLRPTPEATKAMREAMTIAKTPKGAITATGMNGVRGFIRLNLAALFKRRKDDPR